MKNLAISSVVAALAFAVQARGEEVKLVINGAHCCAAARLATAFEKVPGVTVQNKKYASKCSTGGHTFNFTIQMDPSKANLGDIAKAAIGATTSRDKGIWTVVVLSAASVNEDKAKKLEEALKGVKGVDAKGSTSDMAKKEIHVKIDDKGGARLADIQKALAGSTSPAAGQGVAEK